LGGKVSGEIQIGWYREDQRLAKRYIEGKDGRRWCRVGVLDDFLDGRRDRVDCKEGHQDITN
jgi:hypothetical protein